MSEDIDKEIEQIKSNFMTTVDPESRKMMLSSLVRRGKKGIATARELINLTVDPDVKKHTLKEIEDAESNTNTDRPWEIEGDMSSDEDEDTIS